MTTQELPTHELLHDLEFIQHRKWVLSNIIEYSDHHKFSLTKDEAKEQLSDCYMLVARIVFEIVKRNNVQDKR